MNERKNERKNGQMNERTPIVKQTMYFINKTLQSPDFKSVRIIFSRFYRNEQASESKRLCISCYASLQGVHHHTNTPPSFHLKTLQV